MTPISIDPAHFVTILSSLTSNSSFDLKGLDVKTTPLLKSSIALEIWIKVLYQCLYSIQRSMVIRSKMKNVLPYFGLCAVRPLLITSARVPQHGWNISLSKGSSISPASAIKK